MDKIAVTPFAGVWIEIYWLTTEYKRTTSSLPSRECGLKCISLILLLLADRVTPFAGVWIEIVSYGLYSISFTSLPSRECGLKSFCLPFFSSSAPSLPSRECGLKLIALLWESFIVSSLPSRECGLKSFWSFSLRIAVLVTPFAGVWIEIPVAPEIALTRDIVTPFAGVWIEIPQNRFHPSHSSVTPFAGVWIEIIWSM